MENLNKEQTEIVVNSLHNRCWELCASLDYREEEKKPIFDEINEIIKLFGGELWERGYDI